MHGRLAVVVECETISGGCAVCGGCEAGLQSPQAHWELCLIASAGNYSVWNTLQGTMQRSQV